MTPLAGAHQGEAVFPSASTSAVDAIGAVKPDFFVKGPDYQDLSADITGKINLERDAVSQHGGQLVFTTAPTMSSSELINRRGLSHSQEAEVWLRSVRQRFSAEEVGLTIESISQLKVVVVGEMIVDEYVFCDPLGKTSKEPVLAFLKNASERQVGGGLAIAKHVAGLGAEATLVTRLGKDSAGQFAIEATAESTVKLVAQHSENHQTIVKTRYLDEHTGTKVFETYSMTDKPVVSDDGEEFARLLASEISGADVVLVADYGHGLMSDDVIAILNQAPGLVAVNTQSNAGNRGYNSISRYPRVDLVSLNGGEISLELKKKHVDVAGLLPDLGARTGAQWIVVTEGAKGLALWERGADVVEMPAFTERVKDRVGAGDALFATVALLTALKTDVEIVGLLGNLAGAAMVSDLGNRYTLSAVDLHRHSSALLK